MKKGFGSTARRLLLLCVLAMLVLLLAGCDDYNRSTQSCNWPGCTNQVLEGYCQQHSCTLCGANPRVQGEQYCEKCLVDSKPCAYEGCATICSPYDYNGYCSAHECKQESCKNARLSAECAYCAEHEHLALCATEGCDQYRIGAALGGGAYYNCLKHQCAARGCSSTRLEEGEFCEFHAMNGAMCAADGCPNPANRERYEVNASHPLSQLGNILCSYYCTEHECVEFNCHNRRMAEGSTITVYPEGMRGMWDKIAGGVKVPADPLRCSEHQDRTKIPEGVVVNAAD